MPKDPADVRSLARVHTKGAINTLRGIMYQTKAPAAARVAAAKELLNRGWGAPESEKGMEDGGKLTIILNNYVEMAKALPQLEGQATVIEDDEEEDPVV